MHFRVDSVLIMVDTVLMTTTQRKRLHSPHQPVGRWIRVDKRLAVYLRDGFRCLCCDRDLHGADPREVTLDHVVPVCQGGSNEEGNVYTCCLSCNSARADKSLAKYLGAPGMKRIRRHTSRDLARYRKLAKAILDGTVGLAATVKRTRKEVSK